MMQQRSMKKRKVKWIIPLIILIAYLTANWYINFGPKIPSEIWTLPITTEKKIQVTIFFSISIISMLLALLNQNLAGTINFIGWWFFLPVIWNITMPMFIVFYTIIGILYSSWIPITRTNLGNLLVNGFIRIKNENINNSVQGLAITLLIIGIIIYGYTLYQLISTKKQQKKALTN